MTKEKNKGGRPRKYTDVELLENKINAYFKDCDDNKKWYTVTGLALALDIDRKTLLNYEKQESYKKFFPTIKKAKARIEEQLEMCLHGNSVTGIIFNLKNNYDWKDKQEVESNVNLNNYSNLSEDELRKLAGE